MTPSVPSDPWSNSCLRCSRPCACVVLHRAHGQLLLLNTGHSTGQVVSLVTLLSALFWQMCHETLNTGSYCLLFSWHWFKQTVCIVAPSDPHPCSSGYAGRTLSGSPSCDSLVVFRPLRGPTTSSDHDAHGYVPGEYASTIDKQA